MEIKERGEKERGDRGEGEKGWREETRLEEGRRRGEVGKWGRRREGMGAEAELEERKGGREGQRRGGKQRGARTRGTLQAQARSGSCSNDSPHKNNP